MNTWLMKSEPDVFSIDDLEKRKTTSWDGVRNYQARNFMRDQMQIGDGVFFYHSSCAAPGIAGLASVASAAYPDATQFDPASRFFDAKASPEKPRWLHVDVRFVAKCELIALPTLRSQPELAQMGLLQKGSRLSISPVSPAEWDFIEQHLVVQA